MYQIPPPISELTLAATPNAVAWARRHTVDILQRWRFPDEGIEVARLLVSELATNAIQHARPTKTSEAAAHSVGIGTIVLMLWPTDGGIILAVSDPDPRPPAPRASDASATGAADSSSSRRWPTAGATPPRNHTPGRSSGQRFPLVPAAPWVSQASAASGLPRCSSGES
ncbi:ATP-binding protein [Streptomyces ipomoeae]|uniref:ATP-binding protein n=1 Tax=Streptomyces ipomoeae TaxID=103232 RepID=UPI00215C4428|nr:ATP-binding protein [Streptomyces ipomoeae]